MQYTQENVENKKVVPAKKFIFWNLFLKNVFLEFSPTKVYHIWYQKKGNLKKLSVFAKNLAKKCVLGTYSSLNILKDNKKFIC